MFNDGGMKIFRKIHLWFSVPFGLIITLVCFSGAMLVFEPELTRCIKSEMYYVSDSEGDPVDMKILMETVKASLPGFGFHNRCHCFQRQRADLSCKSFKTTSGFSLYRSVFRRNQRQI